MESELTLINVSHDTNYLVYMLKYDTILGKYAGPLRSMAILWSLMDTEIASHNDSIVPLP